MSIYFFRSFPIILLLHSRAIVSQSLHARESFPDRHARDLNSKSEINWDELDDLPPEWDRVESGIDDLLSLSTSYWEPGLGPRSPRRSGSDHDVVSRGRSDLHDFEDSDIDVLFEDDSNPTSPQLDKLMHQAITAVNGILDNLEKDKGEKKVLPKKATRNVTLAALLIEEVTKRLATE